MEIFQIVHKFVGFNLRDPRRVQFTTHHFTSVAELCPWIRGITKTTFVAVRGILLTVQIRINVTVTMAQFPINSHT